MNDFVFVKDLAKDIGLDRSSVLKALKKSGYKIEKARCNIAAQMVACVSKDDAERFKAHRESLGFIQKDTPENLIYVVHPDFEKRPNRIKVGITTDMQNRMSAFKNICPECSIVKTWAVPPQCEPFAHAVASNMGEQISQEVFDIDDVDEYVNILEMAFSTFN